MPTNKLIWREKTAGIPINDLDLIQQTLAGDNDAFAALVRRYQERIIRFCLLKLSNFAEAEDVAQDVFVKAYRSLRTFRAESSFSTWLHQIALNQCVDLLRNKTRRKTESLDELVDKEGGSFAQILGGSPAESAALESKDLLNRLLQTLPAQYQDVLIMREIQRMSYEEISQALNSSLDSVKGRLKRARQELVEKLRHFLKSQNVQ